MEQNRSQGGTPVATIRASCPTCGDVELTSRDVKVRICAADQHGSYSFRCPVCGMAVAKPAENRIIDLLVSSGVPTVVWQLPAELAESHHGATVSYDDLLDFHYLLQADGWFEQLVAGVGREDQA